jgi:hypothetical protein
MKIFIKGICQDCGERPYQFSEEFACTCDELRAQEEVNVYDLDETETINNPEE